MPKTGILDAKSVAFKCQNCSCFKQNFFGVLDAKKWHFKWCIKCQNCFMKLTQGGI